MLAYVTGSFSLTFRVIDRTNCLLNREETQRERRQWSASKDYDEEKERNSWMGDTWHISWRDAAMLVA